MIDNKELQDAWDRIARSADGHTIYLHLQKRRMAVSANIDDGTLRRLEGERSFAAQLMGLMAKGIEESAPGLSARVVTFAVAGPIDVSRSRGTARRVTADTYVPGYSPEPEPKPKPGTN